MVRNAGQLYVISSVVGVFCLIMLCVDKALDEGMQVVPDEDGVMVLEEHTRPSEEEARKQFYDLAVELPNSISSTTPIEAELPNTSPRPEFQWTEELEEQYDAGHETDATVRRNVLFLVADDLRPQLESYRGPNHPNPRSHLKMHTPNLDALARRSLQLNRAYVQFSVCNPSRASYMTSRKPDTTQVWDITTFWREAGGNFTTIPQYFKEHGYRTAGLGKIYHPGKAGGMNDRKFSWTEKNWHESNGLFYQMINNSWWAVPEELAIAKPLHDEGITTYGMQLLEEFAPKAKTGEQPFFLAIGYQKPHIPFVFPERYLQYYPDYKTELASNRHVPKNFPELAWFMVEGCSSYDNLENVSCGFDVALPDDLAWETRRAYFGCVSFVDDMVGRTLAKLEELGLEKNTIVVFLGDHGFHLGENGMWGKHTNLEQSTHAPLMIHIPGRTDTGTQSDSIVEFLDLFPTLVEAAGLKSPPRCPEISSHIATCTEGASFLRLADNPDQNVRQYALSQQSRGHVMGYTIRDDRFRYVEWIPFKELMTSLDKCVRQFDWESPRARELYDHEVDPGEDINMITWARYRNIVDRMSVALRRLVKRSIPVLCEESMEEQS